MHQCQRNGGVERVRTACRTACRPAAAIIPPAGFVAFGDTKPDPYARIPGGQLGVISYSCSEDMETALETLDGCTLAGAALQTLASAVSAVGVLTSPPVHLPRHCCLRNHSLSLPQDARYAL